MDFKQLKSFTAVVEYQSFSKAAEQLCVAQPTISTHVRQLEEELGGCLLLRTTKSIEITSQGWQTYRYAVKILNLRDRIVESCSANARSIIRMGASTIPAAYILPDVLPRYGEIAPETYFVTNQADSDTIIEGVSDGQFDVGIVSKQVQQEDLTCVPLCENRMVLITPVTEHYLQMHRSGAPIAQLLKEPIVMRERGSKKSADDFLRSMGINEDELQVVARVNDQETVKNMVVKGIGVSLISEIAARDFVRERRLLKFELDGYNSHQKLYLVYRNGFGIPQNVSRFVEFLQRCMI